MKRILFLTLALITLISGTPIEKDFHVTVEQNGKTIQSKNGELTLERKSFNLIFEFSEPMGLLINGSFENNTYEMAKNGIPKTRLKGFLATGMADELFNPSKEILVSNDAPNYWFYDNERDHRFNKTKAEHGKIICTRTIENIYNVESKTNIKVEKVKKPLYLVFISYKRGTSFTEEIELKREILKINWK
jgi:hypothetical protein